MIAIHNSNSGFHPRWVAYCRENGIPYKLVNCYANDLIKQLTDCKALMWHHSQMNPRDLIIAQQILFGLEHTGFRVFPDFRTAWHFDDKVAQKYLLERIEAPMVPSYVFYCKKEALKWVENTEFPKIFKLRGGAGSANVKLVKSKSEARSLVIKAFGRGFTNYDPWPNFKERWRKYRLGKAGIIEPVKGILRFGKYPEFTKVLGREYGYIYFQDFIPDNQFDIRIIVVGNKAFALKRMVRDDDFRASGSGIFEYAREVFDERCIKIAFETSEKLNTQCLAYDFVFDQNIDPMIIEISYGFVKEVYDPCPGYWDKNLNWYEGSFNPYGWMVDYLI